MSGSAKAIPGARRAALATAAAPGQAARMELRKFVAPTMAECLLRVKNELGAGAVILSTRTVQHRRLLGLIRSEHIEITAGNGIRTMPRRRPGQGRAAGRPPSAQARQLLDAAVAPNSAAVPGMPGRELLNTPAAVNATYLGVTQEIGQLKQMVRDLTTQFQHTRAPEIPEPFFPLFQALRDQQICEETARAVILAAHQPATAEQLADPRQLLKLVRRELEKRLPTSGPISRTATGRPQIIALIGPTGVGKTTTIAKLAANLKLRENRKVGLITIDTYRIAAIDQLKKYAEIIDAPVHVVSQPAEIRQAIAKMADLDYVLIDTAGRSPRDAVKLKELRAFLDAAGPDEVHLVLSTTCGTPSTRLALERFSGVRADRLIFTKLDEAAAVGVMLEVVADTKLPLSYVTVGQDVPNDIEVASPQRLAALVLPEDRGSA